MARLNAADWAAIAREKGLLMAAHAWDCRAIDENLERIPNGKTVRFVNKGGVIEKRIVWINEP